MLLFCLERFSLDFLRLDYQPLFGPLSLPQGLVLTLSVAVLVFVLILGRSAEHSAPHALRG